MKSAAILVCTAFLAHGQIGRPFPGRGKKQSTTVKDQRPEQPLPSFPGALKRLDNKAIVLELDDFRVLDFKRTDKTRFLKNGEEAKPDIFKAGDRIAVEASEEADGYLTAVNVHWEKAGQPEAEAPPTGSDEKAREPERATMAQPPPAPRDPDDPGPPRLVRGQSRPSRPAADPPKPPADPPRPAPEPAGVPPVPLPVTVAPPADTVERIDEAPLARTEDPLIRKAQEAALEFTESLPNYVCRQVIARFHSNSSPVNWRALDVITADLVYENGKEDYRNLAVNGKPAGKKIDELGGSWSTGEFGTMLIDLFSPATAADFRARKNARIAGIDARVYSFEVDRENSHWSVRAGSQTYRPAYGGSVWIDPKTARVLRIEMEARLLPEEFPLDKVETAVDYEYVRLGTTQQFLLPVHSEVLSCQRGTSRCSRNVIDFRNYRKFAGESTIQFETKK